MNSRNSLAAVFTASLLSACQSPEPAPVNHAAFFSLPPVVERKEGDHSTTKPNAGWAPTDGLEALLLLAETESPQVRQAFHDWQAAHAGIAQATALPDPWVSLSGYLQSVETRTGPMDGKFGLSQKFPWPGKLEGAGNRAAALADSARMAVEDARLQARRDFLRSWTERIYLDHAEGI
ncbi:MAG: TolC family protein, partial [Planctomycetota bacterium]